MSHTRVTITLDCDTDAFQPWESDPDEWQRAIARNEQVGRILHTLAEKVYSGELVGPIKDTNGNTVGHIEFQQVEQVRAVTANVRAGLHS